MIGIMKYDCINPTRTIAKRCYLLCRILSSWIVPTTLLIFCLKIICDEYKHACIIYIYIYNNITQCMKVFSVSLLYGSISQFHHHLIPKMPQPLSSCLLFNNFHSNIIIFKTKLLQHNQQFSLY